MFLGLGINNTGNNEMKNESDCAGIALLDHNWRTGWIDLLSKLGERPDWHWSAMCKRRRTALPLHKDDSFVQFY